MRQAKYLLSMVLVVALAFPSNGQTRKPSKSAGTTLSNLERSEEGRGSGGNPHEIIEEGKPSGILTPEIEQDLSARDGVSPPHAPVAIPLKILRFANYRFSQRDTNGDGRLSPAEWPEAKDIWETVDRNKDGSVTLEEYTQWLARFGAGRRIRLQLPLLAQGQMFMQGTSPGQASEKSVVGFSHGTEEKQAGESRTPLVPPLSGSGAQSSSGPVRDSGKYFVPPEQLPAGLPAWFFQADRDGDGQIVVAEFIATGGPERLTEFQRWDHDGDGVITPEEVLAGARPSTPPERSSAPSEPAPATEDSRPNASDSVPAEESSQGSQT